MNEKLLQYLWNFKIFKNFDFRDVAGDEIEILDFGKWNFDSGPDFLFAKVRVKGVVLAGHIELHLRSSDWIFHQHAGNPEFDNLILHAVYEHDIELDDFRNKNIPTLELKNYIDDSLLWKYESMLQERRFIPCEKLFTPVAIPVNFAEATLLKKLDARSLEIEEALKSQKNNYEAVLFQALAYAFGLKVNAEIFRQLAAGLDFSVVNKIRQNLMQLEALFFGLCGWLDEPQDAEMVRWQREFHFLEAKFKLPKMRVHPKFSKLRPPNFPTVRLSQFASLYHLNQNLFSKVMAAKTTEEIYDLFRKVKASEYWDRRFNFGKISSAEGEKYLTSDFVDLILLNAVLPLKYACHKNSDETICDEILDFYEQIGAEKNTVISGWQSLGLQPENALQSQALLYHFKNFCQPKNCLNCAIGLRLLQK